MLRYFKLIDYKIDQQFTLRGSASDCKQLEVTRDVTSDCGLCNYFQEIMNTSLTMKVRRSDCDQLPMAKSDFK